ncbi:MAG: SDR family NAD(P)-dependent oxidoreductase [Pirellulales bacterium]
MPKRELAGCRVLVTGASSGIGRAIALELVRAGAQVLAIARRAERLAALRDECAAGPGKLLYFAGDVTQPETRRAALAMADEQLGGLDILINNAGVGALGPFATASETRLRHIMEVNFFAPCEWTRDALPLLRRGRAPTVVNISSVLGHRAIPRMSEYCASKFAMQGWSEALRAELATAGVGVLVVSPGTTESEFMDNLHEVQAEHIGGERSGVSAEHVARRTLRAMERGNHEIIPSLSGALLVWANRLAPRLVDWLLARRA